MGHDVVGFFIVQLENISNHFRLVRFHHALLMPFIDHGHNLFFRNILFLAVHLDPQCLKHQAAEAVHQKNQREKYPGHCHDHGKQGIAPLLRLPDRAPLGDNHPEAYHSHQKEKPGKHHGQHMAEHLLLHKGKAAPGKDPLQAGLEIHHNISPGGKPD